MIFWKILIYGIDGERSVSRLTAVATLANHWEQALARLVAVCKARARQCKFILRVVKKLLFHYLFKNLYPEMRI